MSLFRYPAREWRQLLGMLALSIIAALATALQPWPLKWLVDQGLGGAPASAWIDALLAAFGLEPTPRGFVVFAALASLAVFLVTKLIEVASSWVWAVTSQRMVYDLAGSLFHRFQRLSMLFHMRQRTGDLLARLTGDTWAVATATEAVLVTPVRQSLTLVSVGVLAWNLDPFLTGVTFLAAPVMGLVVWWRGRALKSQARQARVARAALQSYVHQSLSAIPLVQVFSMETRNRIEFDDRADEARRQTQRETVAKSSLNAVSGVALAAGTGLVLVAGGHRVMAGTLTLGSLLVFVGYLRSLQQSFRSIFESYGRKKAADAGLDRVREVLDAAEDVSEKADARPVPAGGDEPRGRVSFDRVSFGYETGRPVLHDISFEANPGEVIALVGPSGAGKTTVAALVPRLFDPWHGRVLMEGIDLQDLQLVDLRRHVSVVLQDPFLLPLTVAQNIAYGRPAASRTEIIDAASRAMADEFIRQLPSGYDTILGERGTTLSGGQRQRIAIARALLKDAPVLVLDEPSSALDVETEAQIMQALDRLVHGRTTFIITHRFSTIHHADRIVVLSEGRIVETGSHTDLVTRDGLYRELYRCHAPTVHGEGAR